MSGRHDDTEEFWLVIREWTGAWSAGNMCICSIVGTVCASVYPDIDFPEGNQKGRGSMIYTQAFFCWSGLPPRPSEITGVCASVHLHWRGCGGHGEKKGARQSRGTCQAWHH